jgi:hypothetical protein
VAGAAAVASGRKGSTSFLKKRSKKRLLLGIRDKIAGWPRVPKGKSFLVLFFKKERLSSPFPQKSSKKLLLLR